MKVTKCPVCDREGLEELGLIQEREAVLLRCPRCGKFGFDPFVQSEIQATYANERHRLSYAVRRAADRGGRVLIGSDNIAALIATAPSYRNFEEGVDLLLTSLGTGSKGYYMHQFELKPELDFTRVPVKDEATYSDLWGLAGAMGFVDQVTRRITVDGWRRIESLRHLNQGRRQAFVAMWFDKSMEDVWSNGIKSGIEDSGYYSALRIDGKEHNNKIDDEIIAEIRRSGLVVADFTGNRGGVYLEAGYAQGLGLPVIWTCRKDHINDVHFDTRQYSHIVWETADELRMKLDRRIRATVLPLGFGGA